MTADLVDATTHPPPPPAPQPTEGERLAPVLRLVKDPGVAQIAQELAT